jgi:hypothetical protein
MPARTDFHSKNCIRELIATAKKHKPIIALLDPEKNHGGLSLQQVHEQILQAADLYRGWGIEDAAPHGQPLFDHLVAQEPIEWNRIGHFQVSRKCRAFCGRVQVAKGWDDRK